MNIGMLIFPDVTQLDLTGPYQVFSMVPGAKTFIIAATLAPITSQHGLKIMPDADFASAPNTDIIFVPGGSGINAMLTDAAFMNFLRERGQKARYVTSVCTGTLLLAAAGLLDGYRATTHWRSLDLLRLFPQVEVIDERVVIDRNRMTGGGVTAGIDFGLTLVAQVFGEQTAKIIQLNIEYNPAPPFDCGSPHTADPDVLDRVMQMSDGSYQKRHSIISGIIAANSGQ